MVDYDCRSLSAAEGGLSPGNSLPALQHQFDDVPSEKNMHYASMYWPTINSYGSANTKKVQLLLLVGLEELL